MMTPSEQNPTYNQLNLTSNILRQFLFNKEQPRLTPSDLQGQLCCVRICFTLVLQGHSGRVGVICERYSQTGAAGQQAVD